MHDVPLYSEALPLLAPTCYRLCGASNPAGGPGSGCTPLVSYSSSLSDGPAQNVDACQCISASLRMHTWGAACTIISSPHGPDSNTLDSTNSHQPTAACSQSNRLHVFSGTLLLAAVCGWGCG
jgi:hypothetical protein